MTPYLFTRSQANGIVCSQCDEAERFLWLTPMRGPVEVVPIPADGPGAIEPVGKLVDIYAALAWHEALDIFTEQGFPVWLDDTGAFAGDLAMERIRGYARRRDHA